MKKLPSILLSIVIFQSQAISNMLGFAALRMKMFNV